MFFKFYFHPFPGRSPLELKHETMFCLDLDSLDRLRSTTFSAKRDPGSLSIYKDLMQYVPTAISALHLTGLRREISAGQLHGILRTDCCSACGKSGPFLFLPSCSRCCWRCVVETDNFLIVGAAHARDRLALERTDQRLQVLRGSKLTC